MESHAWQSYLVAGLSIWLLMTALWLVSLARRDSSIVDGFWGLGFVLYAWLYFTLAPGGLPARKWLVIIMTTVWGLRLSMHILWRNRGKGEDYRYRQWRNQHGWRWWWWSYLQVFLLQGALLWIISIPLLAAQIGRAPLGLLDYAAVLVWLVGFYFEAVGDYQLARFKADPANRGKVFTNGVWRYTRHPNYFGDAAQWWAFYLLALAAGGWWTIYSPLLMTYLLVRVSGVAMLEGNLAKSKPGYQEYIRKTSPFLPWFPKK